MAKGKSPRCKGKGSNFERWTSNQLSLWVTEGQSPDVFWRAATSGARATQRAKKSGRSKFQSGDLCAIDPIGSPLLNIFTIECKSVKELNWPATMGKRKGMFGDFWQQAVNQACGNDFDTEPLLIIKANRQVVLAFTTMKGFKLLCAATKPHKSLGRTIAFPHIGAHGFTLQDLIINVSYPKLVRVFTKEGKK